MTFTDDDLKRLKEFTTRLHDGILARTVSFNQFSDYDHIEFINLVEALLVRLEAAEKVVEAIEVFEKEPRVMDITGVSIHLNATLYRDVLLALEAWRQAAGK